jgi:hypothetical protein
MVKGSSWKAKGLMASQEISRNLWKQNGDPLPDKRLLFVSVLHQLNLLYVFPSYFFNIRTTITAAASAATTTTTTTKPPPLPTLQTR